MHLAGMAMAKPGMKEADIAARVTEIALAAGGNLSFPVIATIHGETLHNHYHGHTLEPGQIFLLDAGAETAAHYAGDLTSTFPVDTDVHAAAEGRSTTSCCRRTWRRWPPLKPGVPFRERAPAGVPHARRRARRGSAS